MDSKTTRNTVREPAWRSPGEYYSPRYNSLGEYNYPRYNSSGEYATAGQKDGATKEYAPKRFSERRNRGSIGCIECRRRKVKCRSCRSAVLPRPRTFYRHQDSGCEKLQTALQTQTNSGIDPYYPVPAKVEPNVTKVKPKATKLDRGIKKLTANFKVTIPIAEEKRPPYSFPLITNQLLGQLDIHNIISDMKSRCDVNFDRDLWFRPNLDGSESQRRMKAADAYWAALIAELELYERLFPLSPPYIKSSTREGLQLCFDNRSLNDIGLIWDILKMLEDPVAEHFIYRNGRVIDISSLLAELFPTADYSEAHQKHLSPSAQKRLISKEPLGRKNKKRVRNPPIHMLWQDKNLTLEGTYDPFQEAPSEEDTEDDEGERKLSLTEWKAQGGKSKSWRLHPIRIRSILLSSRRRRRAYIQLQNRVKFHAPPLCVSLVAVGTYSRVTNEEGVEKRYVVARRAERREQFPFTPEIDFAEFEWVEDDLEARLGQRDLEGGLLVPDWEKDLHAERDMYDNIARNADKTRPTQSLGQKSPGLDTSQGVFEPAPAFMRLIFSGSTLQSTATEYFLSRGHLLQPRYRIEGFLRNDSHADVYLVMDLHCLARLNSLSQYEAHIFLDNLKGNWSSYASRRMKRLKKDTGFQDTFLWEGRVVIILRVTPSIPDFTLSEAAKQLSRLTNKSKHKAAAALRSHQHRSMPTYAEVLKAAIERENLEGETVVWNQQKANHFRKSTETKRAEKQKKKRQAKREERRARIQANESPPNSASNKKPHADATNAINIVDDIVNTGNTEGKRPCIRKLTYPTTEAGTKKFFDNRSVEAPVSTSSPCLKNEEENMWSQPGHGDMASAEGVQHEEEEERKERAVKATEKYIEREISHNPLPPRPQNTTHKSSTASKLKPDVSIISTPTQRSRVEAQVFGSQRPKTLLSDLKKFARNFKLAVPVPADILPLLAKDEKRQQQIAETFDAGLKATRERDRATEREEARKQGRQRWSKRRLERRVEERLLLDRLTKKLLLVEEYQAEAQETREGSSRKVGWQLPVLPAKHTRVNDVRFAVVKKV